MAQVARQGALPGLAQAGGARRAAGVVVLDDRTRRRLAQVEHQVERRVGIDQVVVRERLSPDLRMGTQSPGGLLEPGLGLLMRVLPVTQRFARNALAVQPTRSVAVAVPGAAARRACGGR